MSTYWFKPKDLDIKGLEADEIRMLRHLVDVGQFEPKSGWMTITTEDVLSCAQKPGDRSPANMDRLFVQIDLHTKAKLTELAALQRASEPQELGPQLRRLANSDEVQGKIPKRIRDWWERTSTLTKWIVIPLGIWLSLLILGATLGKLLDMANDAGLGPIVGLFWILFYGLLAAGAYWGWRWLRVRLMTTDTEPISSHDPAR